MKLKVLGSGSSGNCYLLQDKKETLILECGIPYKTILKGLDFNLRNVVGCLVTHEHLDHSKALKDIIYDSIEIGASIGTLRDVLKEDVCGLNIYQINVLKSGLQTHIKDFTIMPFDTEHDAAEPLGFLIQHSGMGKLLFITDSYYCKYTFRGLTHIMLECNYSAPILNGNIERGQIPYNLKSRLLKSHFSLENVKKFLMANDLSQCRDITLLHLSDGNSNSAEFKTEIERLTGIQVYIAEKGLEVEL